MENVEVTTLAGALGQGSGAANGTGAAARFNCPHGVALSADGSFALVADCSNHCIRKVSVADGATTTHAGALGQAGGANGTGAAARFNQPYGVALSADGSFALVADMNNHCIRKVSVADGATTTLAGALGEGGGANGTDAAARFYHPFGVALSADGSFALVADMNNHCIRKVSVADGATTTLAGEFGHHGRANGTGAAARFDAPTGVALSADGSFALVSDNNNHCIRKVSVADGATTTLAGALGQAGGANGTGAAARFYAPTGVALSADGSFALVAEHNNHCIRHLALKPTTLVDIALDRLKKAQEATAASDASFADVLS